MPLRKKRQKSRKLKKARRRAGLGRLVKRLVGASLIEILIVLAVLSILLAIGVYAYPLNQKKGRDLKRKFELLQTEQALEMYHQDHSSYPQSDNGQIAVGGRIIAWGTELKDEEGKIYMSKLPEEDPRLPALYYKTNASGTKYAIFSALENSRDADFNTLCPNGYQAGGAVYNYYTLSPNTVFNPADFGASCVEGATPSPVPTSTPRPLIISTPTPRPTSPPVSCPAGTCQTSQPGCSNYCSSSCQTFYGPGCSNNPVPGTWYTGCGCRSEGEVCMGVCPSVMCCDGLGCGMDQRCRKQVTPTPTPTPTPTLTLTLKCWGIGGRCNSGCSTVQHGQYATYSNDSCSGEYTRRYYQISSPCSSDGSYVCYRLGSPGTWYSGRAGACTAGTYFDTRTSCTWLP